MVSPFIEFGGLRGFADIQRQAKLSQGAENGGEFGIGDSGVFKFDQRRDTPSRWAMSV